MLSEIHLRVRRIWIGIRKGTETVTWSEMKDRRRKMREFKESQCSNLRFQVAGKYRVPKL